MKSRLNQGDFFLFLMVSARGIQCVFMKGHSQFMKPKATNSPINPKFHRTHRGIIGLAHPIKNVCNRLYIRLFLYIYEYVVVGKIGSHLPFNVVNYGRRLRLELGF